MIKVILPLRTQDAHGAGHYGAPRGIRKHNGVDLACPQGTKILSPRAGTVTKIGYPYDPNKHPEKGHLRYVQVTELGRYLCRYFYVLPSVTVGENVMEGDELGVTQGLLDIYPGITDHFHYEIKTGPGAYLDPNEYMEGRT